MIFATVQPFTRRTMNGCRSCQGSKRIEWHDQIVVSWTLFAQPAGHSCHGEQIFVASRLVVFEEYCYENLMIAAVAGLCGTPALTCVSNNRCRLSEKWTAETKRVWFQSVVSRFPVNNFHRHRGWCRFLVHFRTVASDKINRAWHVGPIAGGMGEEDFTIESSRLKTWSNYYMNECMNMEIDIWRVDLIRHFSKTA